MGQSPVTSRALPVFLGLVFIIPGTFGIALAGELILKWDWALQNAPAHVDNLPLFFHVIFSVVFLGLGALQLLPRFRALRPEWHRGAGRITAMSGILAAATAIWMTANHPGISTPLLFYGRIVFGVLWAVFIMAAVRAILRRKIAQHRAHMIRAYAIAMNAGTLAFIFIPIMVIFGEPQPIIGDAIQVAGWLINLAVGEMIIRRKPRPQIAPVLRTSPI